MTLSLATITPYGIVLSADSRQSYRNLAGAVRIGSDSAMKLFEISPRVGVAIAGIAFLQDAAGAAKDVGFFIEEFRREKYKAELTVKAVAEGLNQYLSKLFVDAEINNLRNQIQEVIRQQGGTELTLGTPDGNLLPYSFKDKTGRVLKDAGFFETVHFLVAGVDDDKVPRAYSVNVPKGINNEKDTRQCGAMWIGQSDVLMRIVKGFAPEIGGLEFLKKAAEQDEKAVTQELNKLEYLINWGTMTLQDAIDFSILITRTTESIQRFSDGTVLSPGGITGVGGEIDVAVITPEKGFVWVKKKVLTAEGNTVDLDEYENLGQSGK